MERKKRSKGRGWESCYVRKIYGTFGVEMRAYGQKLVQFCKHLTLRFAYEPHNCHKLAVCRPLYLLILSVSACDNADICMFVVNFAIWRQLQPKASISPSAAILPVSLGLLLLLRLGVWRVEMANSGNLLTCPVYPHRPLFISNKIRNIPVVWPIDV